LTADSSKPNSSKPIILELKMKQVIFLAAAAIAIASGWILLDSGSASVITVNDRAAWGIDESGNLVTPPADTIRVTLK
jgi:hypothetical protein